MKPAVQRRGFDGIRVARPRRAGRHSPGLWTATNKNPNKKLKREQR
jgi:hypothetical protein